MRSLEPTSKEARTTEPSEEQAEHVAMVVAAGVPSWMPLWVRACQELHAVCEANVSGDPAKDLSLAMTAADEVYREVLRDGGLDVAGRQLRAGAGRGELSYEALDRADKEAATKAMVDQLKKHFELAAVGGVPHGVLEEPGQEMSSRIVLTRKNDVVKGRWTIGGNQDKEAGMWETYSPTAMNLGHFMVIWLAVMQNWWLFTADVSAAFLQGEPLPAERVIYMRIPTIWPTAVLSWLQAFLVPAFRWDLVRVRKGIFGLPESPYL